MRNYSEKEMTIFGGVLKLAREGTDLSRITAKQIADAAGMGKATIYDYFSSKEEIIVKALVFALENQNMAMREKLARLSSFRERMMAIFGEILNTVENSSSVYNIITGSEIKQAVISEAEKCLLEETAAEINITLMNVLRRAVEKGEIACSDMEYASMAMTGVIFTTGKYRAEKRLPRNTICENSYKMLIKALS